MIKLAIFGSGRGSNFQSILDAIRNKTLDASIEVVIVNVPDVQMIEKARSANINTHVIPHIEISREKHEDHILETLSPYDVDLIVLAGYMRILSPKFLNEINTPIINIHPSLLPSFPGIHAQKQALDYGVKITGCTVHQVNQEVDGGKILDQTAVEVKDNDTLEQLSNRILKQEHILLPKVIQKIAIGKIKL